MGTLETLIRRARKTQHGFRDIQNAAEEAFAASSPSEAFSLARALYASEFHQARVLGTFLFGMLAAKSVESLAFLRGRVSRDTDWRVQETLAKAFDRYCKDIGYETALPVIEDWLADANPNVRRAVTEGLRIWTAREPFREHPGLAIRLLSRLKTDESEYVRKSTGNALRDISRKHPELIRAELRAWDASDPRVRQVHRLAGRFLE